MSLDQLVHAARVAAGVGVVAAGLGFAVMCRRRPIRPPRVKEWLPEWRPGDDGPPYRWVDAPDRDVPVVIPAQRPGGTA